MKAQVVDMRRYCKVCGEELDRKGNCAWGHKQ